MMTLKLFAKKKFPHFFTQEDWVPNPSVNSYSLRIPLGKIKINSGKKVYLYMRQGDRYIYMNEGFETVKDSQIFYTAHFPFSGKISIK